MDMRNNMMNVSNTNMTGDMNTGSRSANLWMDGVMGVIIGDALGNPVQFMSRSAVQKRGLVKGMESGGVFNMPAGCWTDDGSMTLASLDSLTKKRGLDYDDMMHRFIRWDGSGAYTPTGRAYDQGLTCMSAIDRYAVTRSWQTCGKTGEHANGNGALMRIMPVCLYAALKEADGTFTLKEAVQAVHNATLLTHNHLRACTASGIYFFMCREILRCRGLIAGGNDIAGDAPCTLQDVLQRGMDAAVAHYTQNGIDDEFSSYARMKDMKSFASVPAEKIRSSGYVVHTLDAAVWSLITTTSLEDALLKAVNLGDDADTVGAVAGGLAGLFYGYDSVPAAWKNAMKKRDWLEDMCSKAAAVQF